MTARAASRIQNNNPGKKTPGRSGKKPGGKKPALAGISEYSLAGFLDDEPDLYSVADIKVRYK